MVMLTYLVADVTFDIMSVTVETIFICFCVDTHEQDGSEEQPYFMSNRLLVRKFPQWISTQIVQFVCVYFIILTTALRRQEPCSWALPKRSDQERGRRTVGDICRTRLRSGNQGTIRWVMPLSIAANCSFHKLNRWHCYGPLSVIRLRFHFVRLPWNLSVCVKGLEIQSCILKVLNRRKSLGYRGDRPLTPWDLSYTHVLDH